MGDTSLINGVLQTNSYLEIHYSPTIFRVFQWVYGHYNSMELLTSDKHGRPFALEPTNMEETAEELESCCGIIAGNSRT